MNWTHSSSSSSAALSAATLSALAKNFDLGTMGNSIAGIVGGGIGVQILTALVRATNAAATSAHSTSAPLLARSRRRRWRGQSHDDRGCRSSGDYDKELIDRSPAHPAGGGPSTASAFETSAGTAAGMLVWMPSNPGGNNPNSSLRRCDRRSSRCVPRDRSEAHSLPKRRSHS